MAQTSRGLTYPDSSGHTRLWEHFQALAQTADAAIGAVASQLGIASGIVPVVTATGGQVASANISFPAGLFSAAPAVLISVNNTAAPQNFQVAVSSPSNTGAQVNVYRTGAGTTQVGWIAIGPRATPLSADASSSTDTSSEAWAQDPATDTSSSSSSTTDPATTT